MLWLFFFFFNFFIYPLIVIILLQIYNWLSNSPSEMESYIRPGCVVLTVYLSMSSAAWEQVSEFFEMHIRNFNVALC